ncbi:MAG: C-GCAxxG-C-C family (seleno)protein [Thermodesulfobacteriota bacterium]
MNAEGRRKIDEAGRKAVECRRKGFHCSESVFTAVNDILKITDPSMVRMVTGFHGGGGTHRKEPGINLARAMKEVSSGKDRRPRDELPYTQVGHLCGALASGIVCIGLLYGRRSPSDDLTCVDELCFELHRRFSAEFGEKDCRPLREKWVPLWPDHTCETVYRRGAEMAVELILEAPQLIPECPKSRGCS